MAVTVFITIFRATEISDGKYGGKRTPAKIGKATARLLTPMNDADTQLIGSAIGPMVPSIWNSANQMYPDVCGGAKELAQLRLRRSQLYGAEAGA